MSRVIVDLAAKRQGGGGSGPLLHPAGVTLPFDGPADAALIIPEIRSEIRSGAYSAAMIELLPEAVRPGDRVLVIGAGLGVVSTLIGKTEAVARVIAVEANTTLVPYLERVGAANGVPEVEPVNAVLAQGKKGRVPFFARRDLRASSLVPHDRSWQQVMMVPFMDIDLILTEEDINLIVSDIPVASAQLLAEAELAKVERILLGCEAGDEDCWAEDGVGTLLEQLGYSAERGKGAVLFRRTAAAVRKRPPRREAATRRAEESRSETAARPDGKPEETAPAAISAAAGEAPPTATVHPIPLRPAAPPPEAEPETEDVAEIEPAEAEEDDAEAAAGVPPAARAGAPAGGGIDADEHDADEFDADEDDGDEGDAEEFETEEFETDEPPADEEPGGRAAARLGNESGELILEAALARHPGAPAGPSAFEPAGDEAPPDTSDLPPPAFTSPELWTPARPVSPSRPAAPSQPSAPPAASMPSAPTTGGAPGDTEAERLPDAAPEATPEALPAGSGPEEAAEDITHAAREAMPERAPQPAPQPVPPADTHVRHPRPNAAWPQGRRLRGIALIALLLALPLMLIGEIASHRASERAAAAGQVAAEWGGAQTLTGPFMVVPVASTAGAAAPLVLLPERLEVVSELATELRRQGGFEVPVYRGRHEVRVDFDPARGGATLGAGETVDWEAAALVLGVSEPRALRGALTLDGATGSVAFDAGIPGDSAMPGMHAPTGDPRGHEGGWRFTIELDGTQSFALTPAGRVTDGHMRSNWPTPAFAGAFLPERRAAGPDGFAADWSVPQLAHGLPQAFRGTERLSELTAAAFAIELARPADLYDNAGRAVRYGLMLIVLTFGAILVLERWAPRPPHVAQYALVGAAQCCFFVLLLSLAEQIGLVPAYALASAAVIALLTAYGWFGIGLGRRALWLGGALVLLHAVMYLVLAAAELALLTGAIMAFAAVGALMWGTRNEDWSAIAARLWPRNRPQAG